MFYLCNFSRRFILTAVWSCCILLSITTGNVINIATSIILKKGEGKMKNKRLFLIVVAVLFVLVFNMGVSAEMRKGAITLSPSVGGYVFDGYEKVDNDIAYGLGIGYNISKNLALEGDFNFVDTDSDSGKDVNAYVYRVGALYHFMTDTKIVPYIAAGLGAIHIDGGDKENGTDPLLNYGAGLKYFVTENIAIRGDARHIITDDVSNFIYTVGVTFLFGGEKEKVVGPPQPAPPVPAPAPKPVDSDGDGVYDDKDECPGTPVGVPVDSVGCPKDSDKDGVPDYLDKCPDTPQTLKVDEKGCPVPLTEKVSIDLKVEFDTDKADIKSIYHDDIQKVADFLKGYPNTHAVIEGHTDSVGSEKYNTRLSQRRAESVKGYIVTNYGIDPSRLEARGFGELTPIADNKTKEGRQKNRRVVAVISATVTKYMTK